MKNYLKKKFNYTKEQIDHILKHTSIKNLSTLVERVYDLTNKLGFTVDELKIAIYKSTDVIDYTCDNILEKREFLNKSFGVTKEEFKVLIVRDPEFLSCKSQTLLDKCEMLSQALDISQKKAFNMFYRCPKLLSYSKESLSTKINLYLRNGISEKDLSENPFFLNTSTKTFITRLAICKYFYIPLTTFLRNRMFMENEDKLFSRLSFLKSRSTYVHANIDKLKSTKFEQHFDVVGNIKEKYPFNQEKKKEVLKCVIFEDETTAK